MTTGKDFPLAAVVPLVRGDVSDRTMAMLAVVTPKQSRTPIKLRRTVSPCLPVSLGVPGVDRRSTAKRGKRSSDMKVDYAVQSVVTRSSAGES
jgi:hypothetical protein